MKIVKSMISKAPSIEAATSIFSHFLSAYQERIIQISGPFISISQGYSSLPDYVVSGSIIVEDREKLNG